MLNRRNFLGGLIAAPAVVAVSSLMPIRGIVMDVGADGFTEARLKEVLAETWRRGGQPYYILYREDLAGQIVPGIDRNMNLWWRTHIGNLR